MGRREVRAVTVALREVTSEAVKKIVLDVTSNLIETTPVDTGWARNNWVPSIKEPIERAVGTREEPVSGQQQVGIAEVATTYKLEDGPVYISNNVPYIGNLNDGSSKQAPTDFVFIAILRALRQ